MKMLWRTDRRNAGPDLLLVRRMLAGHRDAADEFYSQYCPRLYRFALRRTGGDEDLAEEVVQSSLCRAIEKLASFRGEASLFTWLCTICRNELGAFGRKAGRQIQLVLEDSNEIQAALSSLGTVLDPCDLATRQELADRVRVVLDHLPLRYCSALEWKYFEGLTAAEIAGRLGTSTKAADVLLVRARRAFRDGFQSFGVA